MNPSQYTADAICESMGLPAFVEQGWSPVTLRLLLKPSFDAELCITLTGSAEDAQLSVVALAERLWAQPAPCALASWRERVKLRSQLFDHALEGFAAALKADGEAEGRMVSLDGMGVAACLLSAQRLEQFDCHPYRPAVRSFVASMILMAWESCRDAGVRNALASLHRYVGRDLPRDPAPPVPELVRLAVIGTPDMREDFFGMLRSQVNAAEPAAAPDRDGE